MSVEANGQVRLGVVGLGVMGARVLDAAVKHPDFAVVRAADLNEDTVARVRSTHPELRFSSPQELVAADDLDAVYIATPPATHAALAIAAMESGKAVLCEKPLAVDLDEGRRMCEAAERTGVAVGVNFPFSDFGATLEMERSLRAGELGRILGVEVRLVFPLWPRPFQASARWVGEREQGGFIREVFSHFGYLTDRLVGPLRPVEVGVELPADPAVSEVSARGLLRAGDVPVHVSGIVGAAAPESYEWLLWGERRSFLLRDWSRLSASDGGDWTPVELPSGASGATETRLSLFARAVRGERSENLADFAVAYRVQEAVEAFHGNGDEVER